MCPIMSSQSLLVFLFFFFLFLWAIVVPVYLISRMEKIIKLLEKKDRT